MDDELAKNWGPAGTQISFEIIARGACGGNLHVQVRVQVCFIVISSFVHVQSDETTFPHDLRCNTKATYSTNTVVTSKTGNSSDIQCLGEM